MRVPAAVPTDEVSEIVRLTDIETVTLTQGQQELISEIVMHISCFAICLILQ